MTYTHKNKRPGTPKRGPRPSIGHKVRKLETDTEALLEAFDMLHAEVEALRLRLARHLAEADIEIIERR